jgi:hypothetical protein
MDAQDARSNELEMRPPPAVFADGNVVAADGNNVVLQNVPAVFVPQVQRTSCASKCCSACSIILFVVLTAIFSLMASSFGKVLQYSTSASLDGTVHLRGNSAPATVETESNGFMHIVAATQIDVYRTLGFVSSKLRLLQMDFQRRVGRGNLSVFLGSSNALPIDIYFRQLGWCSLPLVILNCCMYTE